MPHVVTPTGPRQDALWQWLPSKKFHFIKVSKDIFFSCSKVHGILHQTFDLGWRSDWGQVVGSGLVYLSITELLLTQLFLL